MYTGPRNRIYTFSFTCSQWTINDIEALTNEGLPEKDRSILNKNNPKYYEHLQKFIKANLTQQREMLDQNAEIIVKAHCEC